LATIDAPSGVSATHGSARECRTPLYTRSVAHAHEADLKTQEKYGVKYLRYWFDEDTCKVFCLIEAPNKEAAIAVHREAHGLLADELTEVTEGV
jgi:hypothetical protein